MESEVTEPDTSHGIRRLRGVVIHEMAWALNQVSSCDVSAPVGGLDGGRERMLEQL